MGALKLTYHTNEAYPFTDEENTSELRIVHKRGETTNPRKSYYAPRIKQPGCLIPAK